MQATTFSICNLIDLLCTPPQPEPTAGYETTANSISMTLHAISAHPRVQVGLSSFCGWLVGGLPAG